MGGISDVDLENGPVEEPEGKRARGREGQTDYEKGETRGRNESQPLLLSLCSQAQSRSKVGEKCRGNSRYSNLQNTKPTKVHPVLKP